MAPSQPGDQDRTEAIRRLLQGVTDAVDPVDIAMSVADLQPEEQRLPRRDQHGPRRRCPLAGIDRGHPVPLEDFTARYMPEVDFNGKQNRRITYAIHTTAAVRAGLESDLLDEAVWWPDGYWSYALYATIGGHPGRC